MVDPAGRLVDTGFEERDRRLRFLFVRKTP
jgi:hypothetical protein